MTAIGEPDMEQIATQSYLEDRLSIADLITGWIHRDLAEWDQLRNLFHPDATIEITWFAGKASDFVDGSMKMGTSDFKAKHVITSPVVTLDGDKAIAETNAIVAGDNAVLGVGCERHARFYANIATMTGRKSRPLSVRIYSQRGGRSL